MTAGRPAEAGQVTAELAVAFPIVLLLALTLVQAALVLRDDLVLVDAAREAARAASLDPDPTRMAAAAAGELAAGRSGADAERIASLTAAANGARLLRCDCGGPAVTVHVSVTLSFSRPVSGLVRAAARAELHPECPG